MVSVPANAVRSSAAAAPPRDATKHESHLEGAPRYPVDATRDATDAICHSADGPRLASHSPRKNDDARSHSIEATREATAPTLQSSRPRGPRPDATRVAGHSPTSPHPAATKPPTITKPPSATKPPTASARHSPSTTSKPVNPVPIPFLNRAHLDDIYYDAKWHTNLPRAAARPLLRVPSQLGFECVTARLESTTAVLEYTSAVPDKREMFRRRPSYRSKSTHPTMAFGGAWGPRWLGVREGKEAAVQRYGLVGGVKVEDGVKVMGGDKVKGGAKPATRKLPSKYQPELTKQSTDHTKQSPTKPSVTPKPLAKPGPAPKTHTPKQSDVEDIAEYEALLKGRDMAAAAGMGGEVEDGAAQEDAPAAARKEATAVAQEHATAVALEKATPAGRENVSPVAQAPPIADEERAANELSAPATAVLRAFGRDRANEPAAGAANVPDGQPYSAAPGSQPSGAALGTQSSSPAPDTQSSGPAADPQPPADPPQSVEDALMQEQRARMKRRAMEVLEYRRRQVMLWRPHLVQPSQLGDYTHPQHVILEPPLRSEAPPRRAGRPTLRMLILSLLAKERVAVPDDGDVDVDGEEEEDDMEEDEDDTEYVDDMAWANAMTDKEAAAVDWDALLAQEKEARAKKERKAWAKKRKAFLAAYDPQPPAKVDVAERVRLLRVLDNPVVSNKAVARHDHAVNKRCAMYIEDAQRAYYAKGTPRKATQYSFLMHRSPFLVHPPTLRWSAVNIFAWFAANPTHDDADIIEHFEEHIVGAGRRVQAEVFLDVFRHVRKFYGGGGRKDGFSAPDFLDEFRWELVGEDGPDVAAFEDLIEAAFEVRGAGDGLMNGDVEMYVYGYGVLGDDDDGEEEEDDDDDDVDEDGDVKMHPFDAYIATPGARREVSY